MGRLYTVFPGRGLASGIECFGTVYGGDRPIPVGDFNELELYLNYQNGSVLATTMVVRLYWTNKGAPYYQPSLLTDANPTVVDSTKVLTYQLRANTSFTLAFGAPAGGSVCRIGVLLTDSASVTCSFALHASPRLR